MNREEQEIYRDYMVSRLPNGRKASGGREINCQCFYHDDHSRHLYISVPEDGELSTYYCQNCRIKGVVTPEKLNEWNVYDDTIASLLIKNNKKVDKRYIKNSDRSVYILSNNYVNNDDLSKTKLEYLNNRIGTNLTYADCINLKICLNLNDLLKSNKITKLTRNESIVNELDLNFIGFISLDNAFVNLRRIVDEGKVYKTIDKRYVNYNIFGKLDNIERFYTIPTYIDAYQRIQLHIAEGPFDILSVFFNVRQQEPGIYTAMSGNNYIGMVKYFILSMKLFYIDIHLYPDAPTEKDRSGDDMHMKRISEMCEPLGINVYIHRNVYEGEKDFGVPPERIKEEIYKL